MLYTKMYRILLTSSRLRLLKHVNTNAKCLYSSGSTESKKVHLHDFHVSKKAKMTAFGGYLMPLQYSQSIIESHKHTREHVSIFDVSHMLQTVVTGKDRVRCIESLVVSDIEGLNTNQGTLTVFTNEKGGIIDDLIVTKTDSDSLYLVSNAGCRDKDLSLLQGACSSGGFEVSLSVLEDTVLLAVQGPGTAKVLQPLVGCDLEALKFMTTVTTSICGVDQCRITRCGYTGEDGVEISMPASESVFILESLLASKEDDVQLAGLGARDTLRLEAGLCLYGNDITENTTPVEAGLAWTIGKRRRAEKGFPGADVILKQLKEKPGRKRAGFTSDGPSPRGGTEILTPDGGQVVGRITSGCRSPCLQRNVSMGYVEAPFAKAGTLVNFVLHKKTVEGRVTKMPFVPTRYFM